MLQKLLGQIDRRRFTPEVISLTGMGELGVRLNAIGVPVHTIGMSRGVLGPIAIFRLARLIKFLQPDLVQTWMYHADLLGGLAARFAGFKQVVWCIRHSDLSKSKNKRTTLWVVKVCVLLSRWVPVKIISCSHRAKHVHAQAGYVRKKIHVIPNGFDLRLFSPNSAARTWVRDELGLAVDAPIVGLIARVDPQKNHLGFIEAAALVKAELPGVQFLLVGTGVDSSNQELVRAIAAAGLGSSVHLLGRRDDVPRLMASLDVLASSSDGEGFPNVLGEAMACGVPCVVTDVGDSAEIVGDTGRVVEPGDMAGLANGLIELLRMPKPQREELGTRARARISSHYEIGAVTRMYESFYEEVASSGRPR